MSAPTSRREFVAASGSAFGAAWLARVAPLIAAVQACARDVATSGTGFVTFSPREGADFEALAARMVPSDDTPGAREAGVVHFADRALESLLSDLLPIVRDGLADLDRRATAIGAASFADLPEARQDELVGEIETEAPAFFYFARTLVAIGLVTHPDYGGNQGHVGWQLIGFEDRFVYQPPFGYYDRDQHGPAGVGGGEP